MFLYSRQNELNHPQVEAVHPTTPNVQSSLGFSHLIPTSMLDSTNKGPRRSSVTEYSSKLAQKMPCPSLVRGASNSSGGDSQLPSLENRKSRGSL